MNAKPFLRKTIFRAHEALGLAFYRRAQRYRAHFAVTLKNAHPGANDLDLVLPLPLEADYQEILVPPAYLGPTPDAVRQEPRFGNPYAAWRLSLEAGQSAEVSYDFEVQVRPRQASAEGQTLEGYEENVAGAASHGACRNVQTDHEWIQERAQRAINQHGKDIPGILSYLNASVQRNLTYGKPIEGLYTSSDALQGRQVDCGGYNTLLVACARAAGVPARIVSGFWAGYPAMIVPGFVSRAPANAMHVWSEFQMPTGQWLPADPSVEWLVSRGREFRSGALGNVGSDRIAMSAGCGMDLATSQGPLYSEILQNPIVKASRGLDSYAKTTSFITRRI